MLIQPPAPWPPYAPRPRARRPPPAAEARCTVSLSGRVCRALHRRAMALLTALREVKAADPEVRAPAPLRVTALLEEGGQVRKAFGRQGPNVEGGCSHRARS